MNIVNGANRRQAPNDSQPQVARVSKPWRVDGAAEFRTTNQRMHRRIHMKLFISVTIVAVAIAAIVTSNAAARESVITLDRAACDQLVEHVPSDDVAFTPGKTVDGRDVAPADLDDGPRPRLPDSIPILITAELQEFYDLPFDSPLFDADALIGLLTYDRTAHRFTFNGVELGDPEQRLLAAQCRAAVAKPPAN